MKTIKIKEFLDRVHKRLETEGNSDALIFFEVFLQNSLIKEISEKGIALPNWHELDLIAGDYDVIYPLAVEILHDAASRNFSEHLNTYKDAHEVSVVFCKELNEFFEFKGDEEYDLISIRSYVDMMHDAGLITVKDGKVQLTPKGEEEAQILEREIKGGQN